MVQKVAILVTTLLISVTGVFAKKSVGTKEAIKEADKLAVCQPCHGVDGNAEVAGVPKLAGQHVKYLIQQMLAYKNSTPGGERYNAVMSSLMSGLTEEDIRMAAVYYARQLPSKGYAKKSLVSRGEQLYQGGDIEKGIPACSACHSPDGKGNAQALFPKLSGQKADYLELTLDQYASGERKSNNHIMNMIASKLSKEDRQAVASYIQGLRSRMEK